MQNLGLRKFLCSTLSPKTKCVGCFFTWYSNRTMFSCWDFCDDMASIRQTFSWIYYKFTKFPKYSIYNSLLSSNGMGPRCGAFVVRTFPNRWIRCGGPITSSSRSPIHSTGLLLLLFYLFGYQRHSQLKLGDNEDLRATMTATIATVTMEMLQWTGLGLGYWLDILRATEGSPCGNALRLLLLLFLI